MEVLKHNFKTIFLIVGISVIMFITGLMLYSTFEYVQNHADVSDIKYRLKSLGYYKHVCITKTKWQHEINTRHGAVVDYFLENEPDLKPAFDLNEIKNKKAE